ncbi:hypothetical protein LEP1GSC036_2912 [Leptospira weilii str. 2006001853]|uniref:Uncharacterized protein n=1 Tax=Leptospira weilii str. 2006001853 TaxID=1001589 RepID=A0A828Z5M4_9LEPT|nr:hypothetical protein LEP1GSC036_2912 [Leptospira weilii str. 2006001853]
MCKLGILVDLRFQFGYLPLRIPFSKKRIFVTLNLFKNESLSLVRNINQESSKI